MGRLVSDDGKVEIQARAELLPALADSGLLEDRPIAEVDGTIATEYRGRGRPQLLQLPGLPPVVVKTLRHGGALGWITQDRFLTPGRLLRTVELIRRLEDAGVATASFSFARILRRPPFFRLELATDQIQRAVDLRSVLEAGVTPARLQELAVAVGEVVRAMHEAGLRHADLNLMNLLIDGELARALVIDLESSAVEEPISKAAVISNFERLYRSLVKSDLFGSVVEFRQVVRFARAYDPERWRELIRAGSRRYLRTAWVHRISWWLAGKRRSG